MKKKLFFALCALVLMSCNNDDKQSISLNKDEILSFYSENISMKLHKKDNMLSFDSKDEFDMVVGKLQEKSKGNATEISRDIKRSESTESLHGGYYVDYKDVVLGKENFYSLYDHFENAMNEAEEYYDIEGGYERFKSKYSSLYFPEYEDDYSAYLPVSDKNIAKLLNEKGEVMIGGEIVNLINIDSYDKLIELKLAPEKDNIFPVTKADYPLNNLPETRYNDRKLWINVKTQKGGSGVLEEIVVEVMFRKKGFLGAWYNYSSETILSWDPGVAYSKSGFSSHDYKWAREYTNGNPRPFRGLMFVKFRGFGESHGDDKFYFRVDI